MVCIGLPLPFAAATIGPDHRADSKQDSLRVLTEVGVAAASYRAR
jgi:hypothetical protein